jgi:hypothetical protein
VNITLFAGLVSTGSVWKYLDNGSDQQTAWRNPGFNDTSWAAGPAQLGYGDGDEATVVGYGPDANNKYITTYFRRRFSVSNPGSFTNLLLRLLRDDGGVVYLNGTEVFRSNMPGAGAILFNTLASSTVGGADETTNFFSTMVNPGLLVNGTNVLAVEIHQVSGTSSDISFDLELLGLRPPAPPRLLLQRSENTASLSWSAFAQGFQLEWVSNFGQTNWAPLTNSVSPSGDRKSTQIDLSGDAGFYRLRK